VRTRSFFQSLLGVTALGAAFALALVVLAPMVPVVLGQEYLPAIPVLRALALSLPFQALAFAAGDWLGGIGRQGLRLLLTGITLVVSVPALIFTSREAGALGAGTCYSILTALLGVSTALACWRLIRR
jgi:O-antigen/teichoic acid export membrane protein